MFCSSCGAAIDEDAAFCEHCGGPVNQGAPRKATTRTSGTSEAMADPMLGRRLDGIYELKGALGHGGMGTVYRGINLRLDQPVAVKVLAPNLAANEQLMARFEAEGKIQARLRHPNIVAVQDFVEEGGVFAIVMELVDGQPLDELIQELASPLPVERITDIMGQVLRAIGYAHEHQVIHRDIKPANIIISSLQGDEVAKVMDFGIAKAMAEGGALTGTSAKMGTIWYMSPEQCQSSKYVDARADIYSLGVVLYEMSTGQLPFDGDSELELMMSHIERPVPPPTDVYPGVSPALSAIIVKALAKAPEERYQTAAEMAAAVASLDDASVAPAEPPPAMAPVAPQEPSRTPLSTAVEVTAAPEPSRPGRRSVLPWIVSGVALLAVAALAAVLFLRSAPPHAGDTQAPALHLEEADEDTTAWLKVEAPVAGAVIVVGDKKATTPMKKPLALEAGKHTVVVEAADRVAWRYTFKLAPGETLKLKARLPYEADIARQRTVQASKQLFDRLVKVREKFQYAICGGPKRYIPIIVIKATIQPNRKLEAAEVRKRKENKRVPGAERLLGKLKVAPARDGERVNARLTVTVDCWNDELKRLKPGEQ